MSDLIIDDATIGTMLSNLARVRREFENANEKSDEVAVSVGHARLGERVRGFAHNWDRRRQDLVEQMTEIEQNLQMIRDSFADADSELTKGLGG